MRLTVVEEGCGLPHVVRQRLRVVHQWKMGGLGRQCSECRDLLGIASERGCGVGNGNTTRKQKGGTLWKREEQRNVYVTTVVENRRKENK